MQDYLVLLCSLLAFAAVLLLPWLFTWITYWWPHIRYASADDEEMEVKVVNVHDAMPYLRDRYGGQREPILPVSWYYATFKAEGVEPMKLRVSQDDYYRIRLGDRGRLVFRGKLFVRFDAQRSDDDPIFKDTE